MKRRLGPIFNAVAIPVENSSQQNESRELTRGGRLNLPASVTDTDMFQSEDQAELRHGRLTDRYSLSPSVTAYLAGHAQEVGPIGRARIPSRLEMRGTLQALGTLGSRISRSAVRRQSNSPTSIPCSHDQREFGHLTAFSNALREFLPFEEFEEQSFDMVRLPNFKGASHQSNALPLLQAGPRLSSSIRRVGARKGGRRPATVLDLQALVPSHLARILSADSVGRGFVEYP